MITLDRLELSEPYKRFYDLYDKCIEKKQPLPEALAISTVELKSQEVDSRFVNLKYVLGEDWIFFTNYNSPKAIQIASNNNISALLYWHSINVQIRIKAIIKKTSKSFSDEHFQSRSNTKNALAISSMQSEQIESYEKVKENFYKILKQEEIKNKRPDFWGGYKFTPYKFEFWEGNDSRLNKRESFTKKENLWNYSILQP